MARKFSVFNAVMQAAARRNAMVPMEALKPTVSEALEKGGDDASRRQPGGATPMGAYTSPFVTDSSASYGAIGSSAPVNLTQNPELRNVPGMERMSRAEAAVRSPISTYGPTSGTALEGTFAEDVVENILAGVLPLGMGSLMHGETIAGLTKDQTFNIPGGVYGMAARANLENHFNVATKINAGEPGYHQFMLGNNVVSIVPQTVLGKHVGFAALGTNAGPQSLNQYAAMYGYDPRTVDFFKDPDQKEFGIELDGFIPGAGGFAKDDGKFISVTGEVMEAPRDFEAHMGLIADVYGKEAAIDTLSRNTSLSQEVRDRMSSAVMSGELGAKEYKNAQGETVGYGTGTGGIVTDKNGNPVTSGEDRSPVTFGTGSITPAQLQVIRREAEYDRQEAEQGALPAPVVGTQVVDTGGDGGGTEFTTVSGRGTTNFNTSDYSSRGETFFAEGGQVPSASTVPQGEAPVVQQAGFIGGEPEELPEGMTVADDVPVDVPEGTFVLNAAAVEFMGSADVKKMILEAIAEAERQGIDINQKNDKIPKEDLVSLVVSKGEVLIPPELAKVIGYDRLNKINNRGKAETQKRIEENGQAEPEAPKPKVLQQAALGGMQVPPEETEGFVGKPSSDYEQEQLNLSALEAVEATKYDAYVPAGNPNSGVTIGRGVDLAYHSSDDFKRAGVSDDVIEVLSPFMATGQGKYGPRGAQAKSALKEVPLTAEQIEVFSKQVYDKKWNEFKEKYPEYTQVNPKDVAVLFSHYYVRGDEAFGNEDKNIKANYVTFKNVYQETGDIIEATQRGLLDIIPKGNAEYNRAFNVMNWYLTSDDQELLNKTPGQQAAYTRSMLEAFQRREELDNAPAGFIPPRSKEI